ncbi:MAG: hypothetical protein NTX79_02710 [Candidatus Micrarchaeota archaeon]|nr:hypothetical protein [Candidatus Micrarchaeota archaeon]
MSTASAPKQIGTGPIGPKSRELIEAMGVFKKAGLSLPSVQPCTSEHFREFYGRAGVGEKDNFSAAKRKIMQTGFTAHEKEPIIEVALREFTRASSFFGYKPAYAAIARSDEHAAGTGIRKSAPALSVGNEGLFLDRLFLAIKEVLASRFTDDARIFDKMMGLGDEANGVMLMPYYGTMLRGEKFAAAFPILLSVAYAGDSKKASIFSLGDEGLTQWHNYSFSRHSFSRLSHGWRPSLFDAISSGDYDMPGMNFLYHQIESMEGIDASTMEQIGFRNALDKALSPKSRAIYSSQNREIAVTYEFKSLTANISEIAKALPILFGEKGAFYAEFVMNDCEPGTPVQLARLSIAAPEQDYPMGSKDILVSSGISESIGTGRKAVENVHFANRTPTQKDIRFNETHSGYLLYIKSDGRLPMEDWKLSYLYNAGAIYLQTPDLLDSCLGFHLGGYLRELGIPLLISSDKIDFRKDGKYIVVADEFGLKWPRGTILKA